MSPSLFLLAFALAATPGVAPPPARDDEQRIEELVSVEKQAVQAAAEAKEQEQVALEQKVEEEAKTQFPPPPGYPVAIEDLPRMMGYYVLIRTKGGGVRRGAVVEIAKDVVVLRARHASGYAEFKVPRRDIASVESI